MRGAHRKGSLAVFVIARVEVGRGVLGEEEVGRLRGRFEEGGIDSEGEMVRGEWNDE